MLLIEPTELIRGPAAMPTAAYLALALLIGACAAGPVCNCEKERKNQKELTDMILKIEKDYNDTVELTVIPANSIAAFLPCLHCLEKDEDSNVVDPGHGERRRRSPEDDDDCPEHSVLLRGTCVELADILTFLAIESTPSPGVKPAK